MVDGNDQGENFRWERQPEAERFLLEWIERFREQIPFLTKWEERITRECGIPLLEIVDHLLLAETAQTKEALAQTGFRREEGDNLPVHLHPGARLPAVLLTDGNPPKTGLALRVESITDFLQANGLSARIDGSPFGPYRRCNLSPGPGPALLMVERRESLRFEPARRDADFLQNCIEGHEAWAARPRAGIDEEDAFGEAFERADSLTAQVGPTMAAQIVCHAERDYWMMRNHAGRLQKMRQDHLGLGWANPDHHTFRSSRKNFTKLVALFSRLGFSRRERFYAGAEAGWGAQVMEQPEAGLVLFLDVDLTPEELEIDFAATELAERESLGTVGLWCALHGDSVLSAGLHHLAAGFNFDEIGRQLQREGIESMAPFSSFSYLKQAFTVGERWQVDPGRVESLLGPGRITAAQAKRFREDGALGSHLELIERKEGYKGFNQKNVSMIIGKTDPRKAVK